MARLSISALTTFRWTLEQDLDAYSDFGFSTFGAWRRKLSDDEATAGDLLRRGGLAVSSLAWAGGFTGGDGASFNESVRDGVAAIEQAAQLRAPVLLVFPGPQAGHTRKHAMRLLRMAIDRLLPFAAEHQVTLAIEPRRRGGHQQCSFLNDVASGLKLVQAYADPHVKLSFDVYEFGWEPNNIDQIADAIDDVAIIKLADGSGPPRHEPHRLPLGEGMLPIEAIVGRLTDAGFDGDFELDLVGALFDRPCYRELIEVSKAYWEHAFGPVAAIRA